MTGRKGILSHVAGAILELPATNVVRVAIDGVDGAGKTVFAHELARVIETHGRPVIRASVDSFHNPKSRRYRLGRGSPEGFYLDSYDYTRLKELLLDPLSPGGINYYRSAVFDHTTDSEVSVPEQRAVAGSILLFDGIFLHRPELRGYWDFSIFLDVDFAVSIPRGAQRGTGSGDPAAPENRRYIEGQRIYLHECDPKGRATMIIDNEDLECPRIIIDRSPWLGRACPAH
jgi:uridine kinase